MEESNMVYQRKNISISKEQAEWVRENNINLSRLVQDTIKQKMKNKR